eukprot:Skav220221  [mRNA]  locus=scaffold749:67941:75736:- [translate_table: standard]
MPGLLCSPLHAAAVHCDTAVLTALIEANADVDAKAEAPQQFEALRTTLKDHHGTTMGPPWDTYRAALDRLNSVDKLLAPGRTGNLPVAYRLLMRKGLRLSTPCSRDGEEISGLLLPRREEDLLNSNKVQLIIRSPGLAYALNDFLEVMSHLRREHDVSYRCASDVDFQLSIDDAATGAEFGLDEEPSTALLFAAEARASQRRVGSCEAVRLLLYSGAMATRSLRRSVAMGHGRMVLPAQAVHLDLVATLLQMDCSLETSAKRLPIGGSTQQALHHWMDRMALMMVDKLVTPLHMAVLLEDAKDSDIGLLGLGPTLEVGG